MLESDTWRKLPRPELISKATELGVERAERMTRLELVDEILRLTKMGAEQIQARGVFGVARAMLANMMERGLNLPDAAALIRGTAHFGARVEPRASVATVTLAEIYLAQGHRERALAVLDRVLVDEPEHSEALRVRQEILQTSLPVPALPESSDASVSTEYEHPSALETTGVEVRTGEPPPVTPVPPRPDSLALSEFEAPLFADDPLAPDADLLAGELLFQASSAALPEVAWLAADPVDLAVNGRAAGDQGADDQAAAADQPVARENVDGYRSGGPVTPSELGLSWSGSSLLVAWSLSSDAAPGAPYCVWLIAFERSLGLPIRRELWLPLPAAQPGASGQVRFGEFAHASVSAALGVIGEGETFVPIAPSVVVQAQPENKH